MKCDNRIRQGVLFLLSSSVLGLSLYFEYYAGMQPCPLCLMQRLSVCILVFLCLIGMCKREPSRFLGITQFAIAGLGMYFALRQSWLQMFPSESAAVCMPGLETMMQYLPWRSILHALFWGESDCGLVTWRWLGLTMPAWSAVYFLLVLIVLPKRPVVYL